MLQSFLSLLKILLRIHRCMAIIMKQLVYIVSFLTLDDSNNKNLNSIYWLIIVNSVDQFFCAMANHLNHSHLLFRSFAEYPETLPMVFHTQRLIRMDLMVFYNPTVPLSVMLYLLQPM